MEKWRYGKINSLLNKYLEKVKQFKAQIVVLGCTHYPFVKKEIQSRLGQSVEIIDSGTAIVKRVKELLAKENAFGKNKAADIFLTTADPEKFSQIATKLLKYKIKGNKALA